MIKSNGNYYYPVFEKMLQNTRRDTYYRTLISTLNVFLLLGLLFIIIIFFPYIQIVIKLTINISSPESVNYVRIHIRFCVIEKLKRKKKKKLPRYKDFFFFSSINFFLIHIRLNTFLDK